MGIGLNSGRVMSGNVGSERRVEYTAVGDTTNSAARIEQLTKGTPHQLMLSGATKEALTAQPEDLAFVDEIELRGRRTEIAIWALAEEPERAGGIPILAGRPAEGGSARAPVSRPLCRGPVAGASGRRSAGDRVAGLAQGRERARRAGAVAADRALGPRVGCFVPGARGRGQRGVVAAERRQRAGEARVERSAPRG